MYKSVLLKITLLCLICGPCFGQKLPELGQVWESTLSNHLILVSASNMIPTAELTVNHIDYSIGVDKKDSTVRYISTSDSDFKLNDQPIIGRPLSSFKNKNDIKLIHGWGHYLKLDQDWYAGFSWKKLSDTSKVLWVFKQQFH